MIYKITNEKSKELEMTIGLKMVDGEVVVTGKTELVSLNLFRLNKDGTLYRFSHLSSNIGLRVDTCGRMLGA